MEKAYLTLIDRFFQTHPTKNIDSVFFGGGTPSLAMPKTFHSILNRLNGWSSLKDVEVSMEANPTVIFEIRHL